MDGNPFDISVVIPTFNNIELLKIAAQSVITQQKAGLEIIVVDDSTNHFIERLIVDMRISSLKYIHNIPPRGAVKNWNFGLSKANGQHIILLHHDEYFIDRNNFLSKCLCIFEDAKCEAIIINSCVNFKDGTLRKQKIPHKIKSLIIRHFPSLLFVSNIIGPTSCVILKKELLKPFNENLKWLVDIDWYYRTLKNRKIVVVNDLFIGSNHGHEGQITNSINIKETEIADQKVLRAFYGKWSIVSCALFLRNILYFLKRNLFKNSNPIWKKS